MSENTQPPIRHASPPDTIDCDCYPALEELRKHCSRGGQMLIDRVYAEAQQLHARAKDLENELENAWAEADLLRDNGGGEELL